MVFAPTLKKCRGLCGLELPLASFGVQRRGLFGCKSECKACLNTKEKARREVDPEGHRAYKRERWAKTPRTPEQKAEASRNARVWYANNKDRRRVTYQIWLEANRDVYNVSQARRRARKSTTLNTLTYEEWEQIVGVFNHACAYCLRTDRPLTIDHVVALSKGGPHTADNVVPACKPCNSRKYNRRLFVMLNAA